MIPQNPQPQSQSWRIIFVDLMALMLAFFVLLYSLMEIPQARWEKMKESLVETLNPRGARSPFEVQADKQTAVEEYQAQGRNLQYLSALLLDRFAAYPLMANAAIDGEERGIRVVLPADSLFQSGRSALSSEGETRLRAIAETLRPIPNQLTIEVYTHPLQLDRLSGYSDIWTLGVDQSDVLARFLRDIGYGSGIDGSDARRPASFARGQAVGEKENSAYISFLIGPERNKRQLFEIE